MWGHLPKGVQRRWVTPGGLAKEGSCSWHYHPSEEPGWTRQRPGLWHCWPIPCASLRGDLGFPTCRKPIAEVW